MIHAESAALALVASRIPHHATMWDGYPEVDVEEREAPSRVIPAAGELPLWKVGVTPERTIGIRAARYEVAGAYVEHLRVFDTDDVNVATFGPGAWESVARADHVEDLP